MENKEGKDFEENVKIPGRFSVTTKGEFLRHSEEQGKLSEFTISISILGTGKTFQGRILW